MGTDSRFADQDEEKALLHPAWENTPDETDADRGPHPHSDAAAPRTANAAPGTDDLRALITPLCTATDVLARLDARTAAADDDIKEGLLARIAYTEAAGFLAHAHAWAHPLDLALRDLGLTASSALAAAGAPYRALPQTFAATANTAAWADPRLDELPAGDTVIAEALTLAR